jgi:hypothetical protein
MSPDEHLEMAYEDRYAIDEDLSEDFDEDDDDKIVRVAREYDRNMGSRVVPEESVCKKWGRREHFRAGIRHRHVVVLHWSNDNSWCD